MEKINIAELLKDCPKGMELDCVIFDNVQFDTVQDGHAYPIKINTPEGRISLSKYGCYSLNQHCKCIIFPKGKTTWEGFQRPFKDGDVVTWEDRGSLVACIYKERKNSATFNHHIALYIGGLGIVVNGEIALTNDELCLATEEEKAKLFKAIKDAGYKWNPETKTLEKLIEPKFKVGDRIKEKLSGVCGEIIDVQNNRYNVKIDDKGLYVYFREQNDWELLPNRFNITTLNPFDKVLVRDTNEQKWTVDMFSFYDKDCVYPFSCIGHYTNQCIPYKGNEHLLGTTNNCNEYFKTWK